MVLNCSLVMASLTTGQFLAQFAGLPGKVTAQGLGVATIHSAYDKGGVGFRDSGENPGHVAHRTDEFIGICTTIEARQPTVLVRVP